MFSTLLDDANLFSKVVLSIYNNQQFIRVSVTSCPFQHIELSVFFFFLFLTIYQSGGCTMLSHSGSNLLFPDLRLSSTYHIRKKDRHGPKE